jgi:RNA polymerase sigma factor (sigma-70 family)
MRTGRPAHMAQQGFDQCVAQLASHDPATRLAGRDGLVTVAIEHMRAVAHRMVKGFPQVRRWDETDDIVQGAALRLTRSLDDVVPNDTRHLLALVATQVRRELIDLARRYGGAESFARHHETNAVRVDGEQVFRSDAAMDPVGSDGDAMTSWTRLHDAAGALADDDRELFDLVWYLGLNQEQVAQALGCSVRTVARRWDLVKRQLVRRLEGQAPA